MATPPNRKRRSISRDPTAGMTPEDRAEYLRARALETPIAEMDLPVRIVNSLEQQSVIVCSQLYAKTRENLASAHGLGDKTVSIVAEAVAKLGLPVPESWRDPVVPKKKPKS